MIINLPRHPKMAHPALTVANYFVQKGLDEGKPLSPMKVQKLVYIAHGWFLAINEQPLIEDKIGAWPFGPVIGSIYKEFAEFARSKITRLAESSHYDANGLDIATKQFLDRIWKKYGAFSATKLSAMTHLPGTPWSETYESGKSNTIDNTVIARYYKSRIATA